MLSRVLSRYWWTVLLRGLLWILFGAAIFAVPGLSLVTLTLAFGFFAFIDGISSLVSAFGGRAESQNWWMLLLMGLAGIGVGVLTFISPGATMLGLLFYIALWAIAVGVIEIATAIQLRKEIEGEFWLVLAGVASVFFGALMIARPAVGALTVLWLIGGYAIAFGAMLIVLALRARAFVNRITAAV